MKHWFVFFLALASVGSVKGQQTITLSNGNMVAGAYKQPPTRTVQSVDDGYIVTYTFDKATVIDDPLYKGSIMWKVAGLVRKTLLRNLHCHTGWILLLFQMVTQSMLKLWIVSLLNFHILCHQLAPH